MALDKESIQTEIDGLEWVGSGIRLQGDRYDLAISGMRPLYGPFFQKRGWRDRLHRTRLQLDDNVWMAALKCWTLHSKVTWELDSGGETQSESSIDILGLDCRRALADLAEIRSNSLDGIVIKKYILMRVAGGYDDTALLLRSCLLDCDLVIGNKNKINFIDIDLGLSTAVDNFFQIADQLANESSRYADFYDVGSCTEILDIVSVIKTLRDRIEPAIAAVANQPATTLAGLNAKLKIFEICDEDRGTGFAVLALRRSMFRDLSRLLREPLRDALTLAPEKIRCRI